MISILDIAVDSILNIFYISIVREVIVPLAVIIFMIKLFADMLRL